MASEEQDFPKNMTIILADPRLSETYYEHWIPQDDIDEKELWDNLAAMKGAPKISFYDNHSTLLEDWLHNPPEFVLNQADEGFMNNEDFEYHLVALMDMYGIPYSGPSVEGLVLTKDKSVVRGIALSAGVPAPEEVYIGVDDDLEKTIPQNLNYPVFAKLGNTSGSTGVVNYGLCHSREEALQNVPKMRLNYPNRPILLQEFLSGREISVGVVGNPENGDFEIFHPVEVDYSRLDSSKYAKVQLEEFKRDGNSEFWQQVKEVKAELTPEQLADIKDSVTKMFIRCKVRDYARMDLRMDSKGKFKMMDVNPNCWLGGKYRMMAEWAGYTWPEILRKIIATAWTRHQKRLAFKKQESEFRMEKLKKNPLVPATVKIQLELEPSPS